MKGYIYQIENLITHESYIGQTVDIKRRKNTHFNKLRKNKHDNQKLQNSFNKYGEQEFHFRYWEFDITNQEELNSLECEYIEKYDSLNNGFNLVPGGGAPPSRQIVRDEDIVKFLCIQWKYGDGYGKTCEEIFHWANGTASAAKRKLRYLKANDIFEKLTEQERENIVRDTFDQYKINDINLKRQLAQGGCSKAYKLTRDDYNFAFAAQELGYSYTSVANYLGVKPTTVKDWFNGRSRKKDKEFYLHLDSESKSQLVGRVKIAELSGNPKSVSSI